LLAAPIERSSITSLCKAETVALNVMVELRSTGAASNSPTDDRGCNAVKMLEGQDL
jgi:hypothetical protein